MSPRLRIFARMAFFPYLAVVLFLCFWPFKDTGALPGRWLGIPTDKLAHVCLFLPYAILLWLGFSPPGKKPSLRNAALIFASGVLLACLTELGQALTAYRSGDLLDLVADGIGLLAGTLFIMLKKFG